MPGCPSCLGPQGEVCPPSEALVDLVDLLRRRLRMEIAWLGRLDGDLLVIQVLHGNAIPFDLKPGCSIRREGGLFGRVLDGELPEMIPDTRADPRTADAEAVHDLDFGAYVSTPVLDTDGSVYGMIGCASRSPQPTLGARDLRFLRLLARFVADYVSDLRKMWEDRSLVWHRVNNLINTDGLRIHYQPIVEFSSGRTVAVEALTRLADPIRPPAALFRDAAAAGLGPELETATILRALPALPHLPDGVRLAVNAAPSTITNGLTDLLLGTGCPEKLVVEITETEQARDNPDLLAAIEVLRHHGVLVALDDLGTCYSGLGLLLYLRPDIVKIDRYIVQTIGSDPAHRAVAAGITTIVGEIDSRVIAEGIETSTDLKAVRSAGICFGQGYLLGRPTPDLFSACHHRSGSTRPLISALAAR